MRKEISSDLYNYNKYPGRQFVSDGEKVISDDLTLFLRANEKNAFDVEVFTQRFSDILLKYDYIVGDWGQEQLRLRGFYREKTSGKKLRHISRLSDYLKEYCAFGCGYFILENPSPIEIVYEDDWSGKRKKTHKKKKSVKPNPSYTKGKTKRKNKVGKKTEDRQERYQKRQEEKEIRSVKQSFTIRRKENRK